MAEEVSGGEEAIAEEQSTEEYDKESSESIREEDYQESQERNVDEKSAKPKAESRLERKLRSTKVREHTGELYDGKDIEEFVQDRELTPEEIESLERELKETKYFPVGLNSIDGYIKYWKSQGKGTLKDGIKGLVYLIKGFIDVEAEEDRDVYEKIARMKHTPILYISGALEYPMNIREMEEISGYKIAHIKERKDPDKINEIIEYAARVTGQKPIVIGFSDGGKSIENYIEKYGMDKVSMFYAIAASKFDTEDSGKLKFIDGKKDRIFILEKDAFKKTDSDVFKVKGGHTWTCYDPLTIRQIFDIIEKTARAERHNFETVTAKKAA